LILQSQPSYWGFAPWQGRNHAFKVGGGPMSDSWSEVLLPFSRKKI